MAGRPSKYNDKIAKEILKEYASGRTIVDICKSARMPSRWSLYRWRKWNADFDRLFQLACECNSDAIVEEAFNRVMEADTDESKLVDVQFKSSSWLASRINRGKYGDSVQIDLKQELDISPALALAVSQMKAIGSGLPTIPEQIKEADTVCK